MPRNLAPTLIAFPYALQKGALIVLPGSQPSSPSSPGTSAGPQILAFQYNPESITRTRTGEWEARKNQKGAPAVPTPSQRSQQNSFQGGGLFAKSETIAMKLVFDVTELMLTLPPAGSPDGGSTDPANLGVLPELAVLEQISIAEPTKDTAATDPKNKAKLNEIHPKELLLVLGTRYFPVIVTSMTITEKRFSPGFIPVRAEVDLQMQVLEATEVDGDPAIKAAFAQLIADRQARAAMATTAVAGVASLGNLDDSVQTAIASALRTQPKGLS